MIRGRDTASRRAISPWVTPAPAHDRAWRTCPGVSPAEPCWRYWSRIRDICTGVRLNSAAAVLPETPESVSEMMARFRRPRSSLR